MTDSIIFPTSSGILTALRSGTATEATTLWPGDATAFAQLLSASLQNGSGTSDFALATSPLPTTNSSAWLLPSWSLNEDSSVASAPTVAADPVAATTAATDDTSSNSAAAQGFDEVMQTIFRHEGTRYVSNDGGRESSRYGILQSTARQYGYNGSMRDMTREDATAIYRQLWEKSGAAKLSYPMSLVHFDSYINNPASARKFLAQAGDDVEVYLQLRQARYERLAEARPERFRCRRFGQAVRRRVPRVRQPGRSPEDVVLLNGYQ